MDPPYMALGLTFCPLGLDKKVLVPYMSPGRYVRVPMRLSRFVVGVTSEAGLLRSPSLAGYFMRA